VPRGPILAASAADDHEENIPIIAIEVITAWAIVTSMAR
jgi:hypothetical protein